WAACGAFVSASRAAIKASTFTPLLTAILVSAISFLHNYFRSVRACARQSEVGPLMLGLSVANRPTGSKVDEKKPASGEIEGPGYQIRNYRSSTIVLPAAAWRARSRLRARIRPPPSAPAAGPAAHPPGREDWVS